MAFPWYEPAAADAPLDQGDLIFDCPVLAWREGTAEFHKSAARAEALRGLVQVESVDTVVMTQTCDLAQSKVRYIILCPHYALEVYQAEWEVGERALGQVPTARSWAKHLDRIAAGRIWSLNMLNSEDGPGYRAGLRIVDFHRVFSLPREFLEAWLAEHDAVRLRLRPPYREHLSQAFARFFMRVGLPTDIHRTW